MQSPYRVYAWLNDVGAVDRDQFYYTCTEPISSHAIKLNILADVISASGSKEDFVIFIDGDAFPIGDIESLISCRLSKHKLLAIKRLENNGDVQPHPSFCATTIGFWNAIGGDWKAGYRWVNSHDDPVTDIGGNLLGKLNERGIPWYPLLRSNKRNLHPLFFGIYEEVIYHHGAGFREAWARVDSDAKRNPLLENISKASGLKGTALRKVSSMIPFRFKYALRRRLYAKDLSQNNQLSEQVFSRIKADPNFFKEFQ